MRVIIVEQATRDADDLVARIAVDPLCARIPRRHAPRRIQHADCVVLDALYEQTNGFVRCSASLRLRIQLAAEILKDLSISGWSPRRHLAAHHAARGSTRRNVVPRSGLEPTCNSPRCAR